MPLDEAALDDMLAELEKLRSFSPRVVCSTDIEAQLDKFVQVSFTVSPTIRRIAAHDPRSLSVED